MDFEGSMPDQIQLRISVKMGVGPNDRAGARQVHHFWSSPRDNPRPCGWCAGGVVPRWGNGETLCSCAVPRVLALLEAVGLPNAYRTWYARGLRETDKVPTPAGTWEWLPGRGCYGMLLAFFAFYVARPGDFVARVFALCKNRDTKTAEKKG